MKMKELKDTLGNVGVSFEDNVWKRGSDTITRFDVLDLLIEEFAKHTNKPPSETKLKNMLREIEKLNKTKVKTGYVKKPKLNKTAEVELDLAELEIEFTFDAESTEDETFPKTGWFMDGQVRTPEIITNRIWKNRDINGKENISREDIRTVIMNYQQQEEDAVIENLKNSVRYDPKAKFDFEKLARLISHDKYEEMYPVILKHMIWTTKRRLFGEKEDYCPLFVNFYGTANSGKSQFIKHLYKPFPIHFIDPITNPAELFNDERQLFRLISSYVITMDEVGFDHANVNKIKNIIDQRIIKYRILSYNKLQTGRNIAQLIGTSNDRLKTVIYADSDIRKWCEIDFHKYDDVKGFVEKLKKIDWYSAWRAIDENAPSEFSDNDVYAKYVEWTAEKCKAITPTTEFFKDFLQEYIGETVGRQELFGFYTEALDKAGITTPMGRKGKNTFYALAEKSGFKLSHIYKKGRKIEIYILPTVKHTKATTPIDLLEQQLDAERVKVEELTRKIERLTSTGDTKLNNVQNGRNFRKVDFGV